MVNPRTAPIACALLAVSFLGCAPTFKRNDWSNYSGPGAEYFQKEEVELPGQSDPLEPTNRIVWALNDFFLFDVIAPLSDLWRILAPQPVRTCLVNAARNITYPGRLVSNLLQGEWADANEETRRFLVNTTAGVLGLFDVAGGGDKDPGEEDIGRTLVKAGWEDSTYLVLPLFGPRTTRDTLGLVGDIALDPMTYARFYGTIKAFIVGSEQIEAAKRFVRTYYDPYPLTRLAWTEGRRPLTGKDQALAQDPFAEEIMRSLYFRLEDPWFPAMARTHRVRSPATGRKLAYELWLQPGAAPIAYIVPGLGAHRRSKAAIAAAEMVFQRGFSAVVVSSAMNFDFLETASSVWVPGFAPVDARDVHVALDVIQHDLERRYPGRVKARVLMGLSLGAFHSMYIAAAETDPDDTLIDFDRYLILSPHVDLRFAARQLDSFYNAPLLVAKEERAEWIRETLAKAGRASLHDASLTPLPIFFTRVEAEFLVGLSFRWALHDVIWQTQKRHNMGVLRTPLNAWWRNPASREILEYSYWEYFYAFMLPYYLQRDSETRTAEQLLSAVDLRSLPAQDWPVGKIRIFANENDFFHNTEHLEWLIHTFLRSNVTIEPAGGHLGVLFDPATRMKIMDSVEDLR